MPSRGRLGETRGPERKREGKTENNVYVAVNIHSEQQGQGMTKATESQPVDSSR